MMRLRIKIFLCVKSILYLTGEAYRQVGLFDDDTDGDRENKLQHAVLDLKKRYGRDAVLKGMNLEKGATAIERNHQIGGHRSGN